jgi:gamma-glutamyltranspeptidase/glutathione hydrolase
MPPPSSGGIAMLQVLGILERRAPRGAQGGPHDLSSIHLLTEAFKHAFADRAAHLGDPAFVRVPIDDLLAPAYLDARAQSIQTDRTFPPSHYGSRGAPVEDGGTSHLSVIDSGGMAVACTETINLSFGSLVEVPGFGFALNNEMDDFTTSPGRPNEFGLIQSERNAPAPGKRPLSSMSPTIVLARDGAGERAVIVAGASGGPRIITATLEVVLNVLERGMGADAAVRSLRFHHQWMPDVLRLEEGLDGRERVAALESLGHEIETTHDVGVVQVIRVRADGRLDAACDPRKGGAPAGE